MTSTASPFPARIELSGEGLVLRDWTEADLPAMPALFDDPATAYWTPLVTPFDEAYESLREVHILNYNQRPSAIVRPANTLDVAEAVRFASENGLPLAVRSGGHSVPGLSMRNGVITIDVSSMKNVSIDMAER